MASFPGGRHSQAWFDTPELYGWLRAAALRAQGITLEPERGYRRLYSRHVLQAEAGCDFDFLRAAPV